MILGVIACGFCQFPAQAGKKPNVLLILVDDMGYADVGFNGCTDIPTPHIDSIASNGVRFTDGYVTAPQCGPSRAGLMTGISQSRFNREENCYLDEVGLPLELQTFGNYMQDAGYKTGIVGKWHLGTQKGFHPCERGFDWFYGHLVGWTWFFPKDGADSIPYILENYEPQKVTRYLTDVLGDEAIRFIEKNREDPFFLYLAFNAPHGPLQAPEEYLKKFEHLDSTPKTINSHYPGVGTVEYPRRIYAAMVSALDDAIGRVLQSLRDNGIEEDTLIYFLSDNGGPVFDTAASNEPFRGIKGDLLEGGIRVPFAAQWKGTIPAGQTVKTPVTSLDLLPTSLAAAGVKRSPADLEGANLLPLLTENKPLPERTLYWRFPFPPWQHRTWWAVRNGDWKLIHEASKSPGGGFDGGEGRMGLYNLSRDPHEDHDRTEQFPEIRLILQKKFDGWNQTLPPEHWMEKPW